MLKKTVGLFLAMCFLGMYLPIYASANDVDVPISACRFFDEYGQEVIMTIQLSESSFITRIYKDGLLSQKTVGNTLFKTIETELYGNKYETSSYIEAQTLGGFTCTQVVLAASEEMLPEDMEILDFPVFSLF